MIADSSANITQQIAAHGLALPLQAIRVMPTRTDKVPSTSATAVSKVEVDGTSPATPERMVFAAQEARAARETAREAIKK
jgi:hypothetical protein